MVQLADQTFNRWKCPRHSAPFLPCRWVQFIYKKSDDEIYAFIYASKFSNHAHRDNFKHKWFEHEHNIKIYPYAHNYALIYAHKFIPANYDLLGI
jgi:hypothetical protein